MNFHRAPLDTTIDTLIQLILFHFRDCRCGSISICLSVPLTGTAHLFSTGRYGFMLAASNPT